MTNWKQEFEHKFGAYALLGGVGRFYNGAFANEARVREAIDFIQSILDQKAKEVEELIHIDGTLSYNQGLLDALTILKGEE